jgi:toxin FitB
VTFLLDTNVISEFQRGAKANEGVKQWEERTQRADMFISPVTIAELEFGWRRLLPTDQAKAASLKQWMQIMVGQFSGRILPIDEQTGQAFGRLKLGRTRPINDLWIAATAAVHNLTVVSRNIKDFEDCSVDLLNPWHNENKQN